MPILFITSIQLILNYFVYLYRLHFLKLVFQLPINAYTPLWRLIKLLWLALIYWEYFLTWILGLDACRWMRCALDFLKLNVPSTDWAESSDALLICTIMENEQICLKSTLSVFIYSYFDIWENYKLVNFEKISAEITFTKYFLMCERLE